MITRKEFRSAFATVVLIAAIGLDSATLGVISFGLCIGAILTPEETQK
jgi:hypothetical protein